MEYDTDDKLDMVLEVLKTPDKAKEIAEKYDIAESTLYKWRNRFLTGGKEKLKVYKRGPKQKKKSDKETELNNQLKNYQKRIAELSAELEISKKKENLLNEKLN